MGNDVADYEQIITVRFSGDNFDEVLDQVMLVSDMPFTLEYIPSSVSFVNSWTNGNPSFLRGYAPLHGNIFSDQGILLGWNNYSPVNREFDGMLPGCYQYAGWLFFDVRVQFRGTQTKVYEKAKKY
jgi:hypothetical protein